MNENVKKFYELMSKDKALQAEAQKISEEIDAKKLPKKERDDAYDNSMLALAKKNGYHFTLEDAKEFNAEIAASYSELSDSELDQVAGGVSLLDDSVLEQVMRKKSQLDFLRVAYAVFPDPDDFILEVDPLDLG